MRNITKYLGGDDDGWNKVFNRPKYKYNDKKNEFEKLNLILKLQNNMKFIYIWICCLPFFTKATPTIYVNFDNLSVYSNDTSVTPYSEAYYIQNSYNLIIISEKDSTYFSHFPFSISSFQYEKDIFKIRFYFWITSSPELEIQKDISYLNYSEMDSLFDDFELNNWYELSFFLKENNINQPIITGSYVSNSNINNDYIRFKYYSECVKKNRLKKINSENDIMVYYKLFNHFQWIYLSSHNFEKHYSIHKIKKYLRKWIKKNNTRECDVPINSEVVFEMKCINFISTYNKLKVFQIKDVEFICFVKELSHLNHLRISFL